MATRQPEYSNIGSPHQENVRDDASTDASESLMGHGEKSWDELREAGRLRQSRWQRSRAAVFSCQGLLNTLLLFVILGLLVDRRYHQEKYGHFEGSGDISGFAPQVSQQIKTFVPDLGFVPENGTEFFTEEVRQKWLGIVPKGLGYVEVHDPSKYDNLPPRPLEGPNIKNTVYTTSVTHQLHCLYNIAQVYSGLNSDPSLIPEQMQGHLPHCFEYLRQTIMCCGDTALEGQQTTFPEGFIGSDGWDAKHVCKDYDAIYRHLEENRADNEVWI
ncbi:hypothetical protein INS49_001143 [Diaporthe citri]|uniref:uncharacterized protein n=1 Tax=Diaporthe citri TaxID=83186 RepID=UPI001C81852A|nr:uncharacterized protein INS49_001143 [Diaporthe citri]KAG6366962.1 hypothetical protein INS49_001143 [Diaporthe citri]